MSSRKASFAACVASGSGCPSVGGQRASIIHRKRVGVAFHALALPAATPVLGWGAGIGFAHAGGGVALRPATCQALAPACRLTRRSSGLASPAA